MKITTIILKTLAGTLAVTLLAVFAIWFMAGGVLFMPPFAVIPVYVVLFILSVLVALVTQKPIVIVSVVGGFVLGVFGFNALYHHTCGPNSADVKVMKPMAEKISDYIVKNGIPESLKDIPDLPYGLVGCEKETTYGPLVKTYITEDAQWENNTEMCNFKNITIRLSLDKSLENKDEKMNGTLRMRSRNETTLYSFIEQDQDNKFTFNSIRFSGKKSGICKAWRQ